MTALQRLRSLAAALPDGACVQLDRAALLELLAELANGKDVQPAMDSTAPAEPALALWTVPDAALLTAQQVAAGLGRSTDWLYRRDVPRSRLDGGLVYRAGDVRAWVEQHLEPAERGEHVRNRGLRVEP